MADVILEILQAHLQLERQKLECLNQGVALTWYSENDIATPVTKTKVLEEIEKLEAALARRSGAKN